MQGCASLINFSNQMPRSGDEELLVPFNLFKLRMSLCLLRFTKNESMVSIVPIGKIYIVLLTLSSGIKLQGCL